jgi:hypothetical protein
VSCRALERSHGMTAHTSWGRLEAPARKTGVVTAICLVAWVALLPVHDGAAQEPSRSPSPKRVSKASPAAPTAEPRARPNAAASSAANARTEQRPVDAGREGGSGAVFAVVLSVLIAAGGIVRFLGIGRRRGSKPPAEAAPVTPSPVDIREASPALWHGASAGSSRRATAADGTPGGTQQHGDEGWDAAGYHPHSRNGAAPVAAGEPARTAAVDAAAPEGSPPDHRLAWTAEIEWRQLDGGSRFCAIARGPETVMLAESPPLEWPPSGAAAVLATTSAAQELAATLENRGWKPLPPGSAWYAKRFAWEPVPAEPAAKRHSNGADE